MTIATCKKLVLAILNFLFLVATRTFPPTAVWLDGSTGFSLNLNWLVHFPAMTIKEESVRSLR